MIKPIIHLPFNGSFKDYGHKNREVTYGSGVSLSRFGGGSVYNDGTSNSGIIIPSGDDLALTDMAIAFWIFLTSWTRTTVKDTLVESHYSAFEMYKDQYSNCFNASFGSDGWASTGESGYDALDGSWHHFAVSRWGAGTGSGNGTAKAYHNGMLVNHFDGPGDAGTGTPFTAYDWMLFKSMFSPYYGPVGYMKDFRLYNRGLSDVQINQIYNGLSKELSNS